jgi:hypothetical protein
MISRQLQITLLVLALAALGMGFYALKLKQKAEALQAQADLRPVPAPTSGARENVVAWIAYDEDGVIHQEQVQAPNLPDRAERAREVLRAVAAFYEEKDSPHPLPAGADINAVYILQDHTAVVDLNSAFADGHRSGIGVEQFTVFSLVQTLSANLPDITRVRFVVDGKTRPTLAGHAALDTYYDVATVAQLIRELQ